MSVTRDRSLKVCRQFPAFLLFLWQSMCQIVREWKKAIELLFRVSWVEGIVWKEKEKEKEKRKRKRKRKEKEKEKKKKKKKEKEKEKEKKKKKKKKRKRNRKKKPNLHFFIWPVSQNSVHSTYATILFQVGEFAKIVPRAIGLFNLSRSRPFLSWLCLACLFPLNVSW